MENEYSQLSTLQSGYDYLGKCSFTDDTVGANPTGWTVVEGSNVEIQVISDLSLHRKVVSFWDNNNGAGSCYMEYSFPGVVVGTVELWVFGIDGNAGLDHFGIELFGGSTNAVHTYADWTTDEYVNYMDKSIVAPGGFPNNQWHHIRIVFDCNSDTFTCYVNGNYTGIFNFESPISSVTKIRLGTGQTETGGNFYAYVDAIDFSWETGYSTSRNMQSLQLGYNYLGKCSFTDDTVGVNPTGWTVVEGSNVEIQVISDLSLHRKVVSFWDNNNGPGSCYMEYSFPGVVVGTVELWVFGIDGNAGLDHFGIELFGGSTNAVHTYADWTTDEYVNYMDKSIVAPGGFPNNQWHHIRIVFDCNSDTFTCYVNGNYTGIFNFESPISSVTKIRLGTGQTETGGNFYAYVDAIDFSWETGYYTNRNMQYTTDQQIPMLTPTTVILIVLFSVIGLIIKLNKRYPRYSSGTIDFLKP